MFSDKIEKIKGISLKWKLLIPFLLLAFTGTTTLAYIGLSSQQDLIKEEERKDVLHYYQHLLERLRLKENQAVSLATMIAENPSVQKLLSEKKREQLNNLLVQTYVQLKTDFHIEQFHFHIPPGISFLRLHYPTRFGDDMRSERGTIIEAMTTYMPVSGLERGKTGFGIRGVAPVFLKGDLVGTVEIGHAFGEAFLKDLHRSLGIDLALYDIGGEGRHRVLARVGSGLEASFIGPKLMKERSEAPSIFIAPKGLPKRSILLGPLKDYSGEIVALVEFSQDRSQIQERLLRTRNIMFMVGIIGIAISSFLTYLVAVLFLRPINEIVKQAKDIAEEKRESRLEPRPSDEIGTLTEALNRMLDALIRRRNQIEQHARVLEHRVDERTSDLVASLENYRTLVENVPLIVYRILPDGTTEFINSYLTESLGYSIEEAVGDRTFWRMKICGGEKENGDIIQACFESGEEVRIERMVRDKQGRLLTFIDHAIPSREGNGRVKWVDGIMMDISEIKSLQERALRSEEVKILGEISARMAHEIRNPLISAGGFARRLRDSLPEDDNQKKMAGIIVKEVARLESFLKILLSSIKPFDLSLKEVDINELLERWLERLEGRFDERQIKTAMEFSPDLPRIQGDYEKLNQAFESLIMHAIVSTPVGGEFLLGTTQATDNVVVVLRHTVSRLSEDDLEKFFFPHIEDQTELTVLDLPFSKIIIHRHGGKVDLIREKENVLVTRIELPERYGVDAKS